MLGTVTTLRRYPVKSMLGEDLDTSDVSHRGLARDRRLAVVSRRTGKVASAKYPRLWRDLLTLSASALDDAALDAARITLPGGKTVRSTLRVIARTPRCAVPTLAHGDLLRDTEALRVLARHNRVTPLAGLDPEPCAGVYAEVLHPGRIRVGDTVQVRAASRTSGR